MFSIQSTKIKTPIVVRQWAAAVRSAGGGFENNSLSIASNFIRTLQTRPYYSKVQYLLPMLGVGINAARVPLIDRFNVGAATNVNFVDADFTQATGLQGNGTTKYINSLIKPGQLGTTNNGGLGYWENNINLAGHVEPIGCYGALPNDNRYVIDLRSNLRYFRWGYPINGGGDTGVATNGHFYGQRSSATNRQLFFNGSSVGINTTSDSTENANENNIYIMGNNVRGTPTPWPGRGALIYFTDGTLTAEEVIDFHSILTDYLMIPTGKPRS